MPGVGGPGIDAEREKISRWAPGYENDTEAYIGTEAKALGGQRNHVVDVRLLTTLSGVVVAIIRHENDGVTYPAM